ncbi:MAG: flagellar basal body P-ring formation chaperone FlgA [Arenimonas sp.]
MKFLLTLSLLLFSLPSLATERARVPATDIVAAAGKWLQAKAKEEGIAASFEQVGHINDVQLNGDVSPSIKVNPLKSGWLRPRIGIPVQIIVADKAVSSTMVWFSVTAPHAGLVYSEKQNKGVLTSRLNVHAGQIDLAKTKGKAIASLDGFADMRLRHSVTAGQALQAEDFESIPLIQAQQAVQIETRHGSVRLSVAGRALNDANIGEMVQVLPTHSAQPVRARVVSQQVVVIEN